MEDIRFYINSCGWFGGVMAPGLHAILLYRFGHKLFNSTSHRKNPIWYIYLFAVYVFRLFHNLELPETAEIGRCLFLPHPYGLVMGPNTVIGDDCTIGPWVVLGHRGTVGEDPIISNQVYIGPHACILGRVYIGQGALIGAGVVVTHDVAQDERLSVKQK